MKKARIAASWLLELLDDNGYVVGTLLGDPETPIDPLRADELAEYIETALAQAGITVEEEANGKSPRTAGA